MKSPADSVSVPQEEGWWETVKVIVQALLIALVVRTVLFQPFNIPSGSLIPTLLIGDYLFVSKYSYGYSHYSLPSFLDLAPNAMHGRLFYSPPKRGDIVVFRPPGEPDQDFIKRVIGLPGDKVQMIKGRLYINGDRRAARGGAAVQDGGRLRQADRGERLFRDAARQPGPSRRRAPRDHPARRRRGRGLATPTCSPCRPTISS